MSALPTFRSLAAIISEKSTVFTFSYGKACYQIWPCHKIGQGHSRVIIWTNYDGLESRMLHTMFLGNRSAGSGGDFWRVFIIYRRGGHLSHVTQVPRTNFLSPYPRRLHIKFGFDLPSSFWWKRCLSIVDGWRTDADGQTTDHWYTISSPMSQQSDFFEKYEFWGKKSIFWNSQISLNLLVWSCWCHWCFGSCWYGLVVHLY